MAFNYTQQVLQPNELNQSPLQNGLVEYSGEISHLRMATNYSIEVKPVYKSEEESSGRRSSAARGRAIPHITEESPQVFIQTKGCKWIVKYDAK